ncbi:MAG: UDP-3-O-(3-hydroxymyristoyl)glucosamine N-acyltransferase [Planctomycetes bacterium]|nr:UDP-3-O-(3-hydroxymyristoyl)glucosamine N-acyltransferase [Planctomycetota bacterium]
MPETTLARLAEHMGAILSGGSPEQKVSRLAGLAEAGPEDLTFLANPAYKPLLAKSKAGAVIVGKDISEAPMALLKVDNPDLAFAKAAVLISPPPPPPAPGIHPSAVVSPAARIGRDVSIGALAVVEAGAAIGDRTVLYPQTYVGLESTLGADCRLYPGVRIYHQVTVGSRCLFHAGAVIGSDGFGFAWTGREYFKIPQVGVVVIEDDVEIGANTCVDRARFGETRIGAGTKLDNLIQIAHNVRLGPCCAFAAQVGIAGSASIGAGVQMGGQSAAVGHITLGDGLTIVGQSAVSKSIPGREAGVDKDRLVWVDSPAKPMKEQLKEWQNLKALGRLRKTVKELEERLAELEKGKSRRESP